MLGCRRWRRHATVNCEPKRPVPIDAHLPRLRRGCSASPGPPRSAGRDRLPYLELVALSGRSIRGGRSALPKLASTKARISTSSRSRIAIRVWSRLLSIAAMESREPGVGPRVVLVQLISQTSTFTVHNASFTNHPTAADRHNSKLSQFGARGYPTLHIFASTRSSMRRRFATASSSSREGSSSSSQQVN